MIAAVVNFFFLQNLVSSLGLLLSPLEPRLESGRQGGRFLAFLGLMIVLGALWIWLVDWLFCGLLGLEFLRIFLVFLNLAAFGGLGGLMERRFGDLIGDQSWPAYKLHCLDLPLAGFCLLAIGQPGGFLTYVAALAGALPGSFLALFLFTRVLRRLDLEWLPRSVRGRPAACFSMALVSLIFLLAGFALYPMLIGAP